MMLSRREGSKKRNGLMLSRRERSKRHIGWRRAQIEAHLVDCVCIALVAFSAHCLQQPLSVPRRVFINRCQQIAARHRLVKLPHLLSLRCGSIRENVDDSPQPPCELEGLVDGGCISLRVKVFGGETLRKWWWRRAQ